MKRGILYAAAGCFLATLLALVLNSYYYRLPILLLLPMWGLVLGVCVYRVKNIRNKNVPKPFVEEKEVLLYKKANLNKNSSKRSSKRSSKKTKKKYNKTKKKTKKSKSSKKNSSKKKR